MAHRSRAGRLPLVRQQEIGGLLGERGLRVFDIVGPAVIVLGLLRGTVFGPIKDADTLLGTAYGLTFLAALILAIRIFLWGRYVIVPATRALVAAPVNRDGSPTPELAKRMSRAKVVTVLELLGFLAAFTLMILMRFGL